MITSLNQLDIEKIYSYADYLTWRLEQRIELIKGRIMQMAAPNRRHQRISANLSLSLLTAFQHQPCHAYTAPFDVRLYDRKKSLKADKDIFTVVQPDLCVVCDLQKLDDKGCLGSPDLVVEILSVGNNKTEIKTKYELYEESGVREYWVVFPAEEIFFQYVLNPETAKFDKPLSWATDEIFTSAIFPELTISLSNAFKD